MEEITVVSYNIYSGVGTDGRYSTQRTAALLAGQIPDVVCLQEVEHNACLQKTRLWSEPHESNQTQEIASHLNLEHLCFAPTIRSIATSCYSEKHNTENAKGEFGISTLSRFPIVETKIHEYERFEKKTKRNALACLIQFPNETLVWVVNTHLGCHSGKEQYHQAKELSTFLRSLESTNDLAGIILCGDLNSLPFFRSVHELESVGMIDVYKQKGTGLGCTFPAVGLPGMFWLPFSRPAFRLDYIFMKLNNPNTIILDSAKVVKGDKKDYSDIMASDHLPLCAVFLISV